MATHNCCTLSEEETEFERRGILDLSIHSHAGYPHSAFSFQLRRASPHTKRKVQRQSPTMEDSSDPSPDFEPLVIREENGDPETTWPALTFRRTGLSPTSLMGPYLREMDDLLKNCEELSASAERETSPYFSTSFAADGTEMAVERRSREDLPITLAGNKLSDNMVQYEGQLMGMLAMLESCMEEAGVDFDARRDYVHVDNGKCNANIDSTSPHPSMDLFQSSEEHFKTDGGALKVEPPVEHVGRSFGTDGFEELKSQMEECIEELRRLEMRRKDLLAELLELRRQEEEAEEAHVSRRVGELMAELKKEEDEGRERKKSEVQGLRRERAEEERRAWKAEMERQVLRDEMRKLKRQLFARARESAHTQATLNKRRHEMDLQEREKENLQALLLQMTEEGSRLRTAHQNRLQDLREKLRLCGVNQTGNKTQEEFSKRNSCEDIQQYLQDSLRTLEDKYEPVLLALQKRKETTTGAGAKAKEHARELKAQLGPLREEMQSQVLRRARSEEKVRLGHVRRREEARHYQETISTLEQSSRELKMELAMQKRKNKEATELRDCLAKQIDLYRCSVMEHREDT
ncbi:syncoilin isoform X2 [Stigmatopora argus]